MAYQNLFSYYGPTNLVLGPGSIREIPGMISEQNLRKPLIVTDAGLVKAGLVARITDILDGADVAYSLYDGVEANPPIRNVNECVELYTSNSCDHLIAVGGGSSMDVAKATGVLVKNGGEIADYFIGTGTVREKIPYLLCIPTTYGTASEVTPFAVITDDDKYKAAVGGPLIIPNAGVLDPDMAVALPLPIAAATGMDALTHAIESYVSLMSNPVSEGMALHAIRLISRNLRQAAYSDHNHEATLQMLCGSTMAGFAFAQSRLGNVHAMSHPVGGHYNVPHGVANAVLLTRIMAYNRIACPEKFGDIAEAMGEDTEGLTPMESADLAVETVQTLSDDVGIPKTLSDAGAKSEGISVMAEDAMKSGNIPVNPRKTTLNDVTELYEQSM